MSSEEKVLEILDVTSELTACRGKHEMPLGINQNPSVF